jgi:hypothetical protein
VSRDPNEPILIFEQMAHLVATEAGAIGRIANEIGEAKAIETRQT